MSSQYLKKAAIEKTGLTRQAIEAQAKKIKKDYGPFSDDIAYGVIAHRVGVNVSKLVIEPKLLEQIRDQLDRIAFLESELHPQKLKTIVKTVTVNIGKNLSLSDPIVSQQVLKDAEEMTSLYAKLYVFENSVREVINRILTKNIGKNWWDKTANQELKKKVQGRINVEKKNKWHGRRGSHPIYYTDIQDLKSLIRKHWKFFSAFFPNQEWVNVRFDEISLSRNIIDHHNPLNQRDRQRLTLNTLDWQEQIKANKDKI